MRRIAGKLGAVLQALERIELGALVKKMLEAQPLSLSTLGLHWSPGVCWRWYILRRTSPSSTLQVERGFLINATRGHGEG